MKKTAAAVFFISIVFLNITSFCSAGIEQVGCFTSKNVLISCGGSWDDVYNGVAYHCTCPCNNTSGDCVPVTSGTDNTNTNVGINNNGETTGNGYIQRNPGTGTTDWMDSIDKKQDAMDDRSGDANPEDIVKAQGGGSSRDVWNAKMVTSIKASRIVVNSKKPKARPKRRPKAKWRILYYDTGGVYIGNGTVPQIISSGGIVDWNDRQNGRVKSAVSMNGTYYSEADVRTTEDEAVKNQAQQDRLRGAMTEGFATAISPGSDYLAGEFGNIMEGTAGLEEGSVGKVAGFAGTLLSLNDLNESLKNGDYLNALNQIPGMIVSFIPEGMTASQGGVALAGAAAYTYFMGYVGQNAIDSVNKAVSSLKGQSVDITGGQSIGSMENEQIGENIKHVKNWLTGAPNE